MLNKTIVFTFMQIDKPEAKSQTKPKIPKSQTQKEKGNLASGLSLLKSKSGSGPVGMSYPVNNRIHGLVPIKSTRYELSSYQC